MTNTKMPNIFTYATHELSQDAFICYWLEFCKEEYKNEEDSISKSALKLLREILGEDDMVIKIERQQKNIDALIETKNHYIIIEDKVSSYEHGNQILRYIDELQEKIRKGEKEKKKIICVYFKTGFLSCQEKRELEEKVLPEGVKLKIIGLEDLLDEKTELLSTDLSQNQIFHMFKEKLLLNQECIKKSEAATSFEMAEDKDIFLDALTEMIRENTDFKDAYWFITGPQRTAHISLFYIKSQPIKNYKAYYEMFIMFRKSAFQFIIKEAVHKILDAEHTARVLVKDYDKLSDDLCTMRDKYKKCIQDLSDNDFQYIDKDKLMLLKKEFKIADTKNNVLKALQTDTSKLLSIKDELNKLNPISS